MGHSLILAELQSLRADHNTNARETGERLSSLEWRWRMVGIATEVATVMSGIVTGVARLLKA